MAKQRYVNTKFWSDSWVVELDPLERYLYLYLLTNEHTNIAGVYELPIRVMAFETGIDKEMLPKMLKRFDEKVMYIDSWVCLKNFQKHQSSTSVKIQKGIKAEMQKVPEKIMEIIENGYGIDRVSRAIIYSNTNTNTNTNTSKQVLHDQITEVIDAFSWNVAYKNWYGNKTQRQACKELIENFGLDKVLQMVQSLPKINEIPYVTSATTPHQLLNKYATIESQLQKQKLSSKEKENYEVI